MTAPAGRSLHRQLLLWLLLPQIVLWGVAAFGAYRLATAHADELIDASLLQSARALARQIKPTASGLYVDLPSSAQDILSADPDDRVLYLVSAPPGELLLGDARLPAPPGKPVLNEPVFFDATLKNERLRLVSLDLHLGAAGAADSNMRVQVARSSAPRELLARRMLLDTALPLSLLVALMTAGVWAGIRKGLKPLAELQRQMEGRRADALDPVQLQAAPPEVRALAGALNELLGQVQQSLAAQRRFISDAAHQLRTPLAGLKSQTELALEAVDATSDPALHQRLARVHESAVRAARLVSQLLVLARSEPEAVGAQGWAAVDCSRLVHEATADWVPRALAAGCDLGVEIVDEGLAVQGVALLLREALVNLIDNAVRYAGHGATITVRLRRVGDDVWIDVEDNGPGLPPDLRERAFERFVRGAPNGEGCGLGLAIVREIAERHGGTATLLPAAPQGCIARLTLPAG